MEIQKHLTRIKTGFILGVCTIVSIFYFQNSLFAALCFLIVSAAFWEWLSLISLRSFVSQVLWVVLFWVCMAVMIRYPLYTFYVAAVFWLVALFMTVVPLAELAFVKRSRIFQFTVGTLILGPTWVALADLQAHSHIMLFYVIMLVTFADTAAYFVGSHFGKHKLLPSVSPKKTFEGLLGGLIVGSIAGSGVLLFVPGMTFHHFVMWFFMGLVLILISVVGDLFESQLKRLYGTKDSGSLLPGHGGLLDRLDSLSSAVPVYALGCYLAHVF